MRNTFSDVFGLLLAVVLADLLGRYVVGLITWPISNDLGRLMAGIVIGLLAGTGVGLFVNRAWERMIKSGSVQKKGLSICSPRSPKGDNPGAARQGRCKEHGVHTPALICLANRAGAGGEF